jgi:hypothetical protein
LHFNDLFAGRLRLIAVLLFGIAAIAARAQTVSGLTVTPTSVIGGTPAVATVTLSQAAPAGGIEVSLTSSNPAASVPKSVKVNAGSKSATASVKTVPVAANATVTLSARLNASKATATLKVTAPTIKSMSLSPATVLGGNNATGTVTLTGPAPPSGLNVTVSSNIAAAKVSSPIFISGLTDSASFTVVSYPVASEVIATITVAFNGSSIGQPLTVEPPTLLSFTISPTSVVSGNSATGTITLTGNAPTTGFNVTVKSNEPFAQVVTPVVVPGGTNTTTFPITTSYVYPAATATIYATVGTTTLSAKLAVAPGNPYSSGPWPKYAADAANTGRSRYGGAKGKLKWTLDFHGGSYGAPLTGKNEVATLAANKPDPEFLIFSLSGTLLYEVPLPQYGPLGATGNPVVGTDGTFYVPIQSGLDAISPNGKVLWTCTVSTTRNPVGSPCVGGNGTIYLDADAINAISPAGKLMWSYSYWNPASLVPAADGTVYIVDGNVTAISSAGKSKWTLNSSFSAGIVGGDGTLYLDGIGGGEWMELAAVSPEGSVKWSYKASNWITSAPVVGANGNISFGMGNTVETITPAGKLAWTYSGQDVVANQLSAGPDGSIYVATGGSFGSVEGALAGLKVLALSANGSLKWTLATPYACSQVVGEADGSALLALPYVTQFTTTEGNSANFQGWQGASASHFAHILPTGKIDWTFSGGGPIATLSIDANGTMYAACGDNRVQTVLPNGTLGWQFETSSPPSNTPTLGGDGTVYVGTLDGTVYALTPSGAKKWSYKAPAAVTAAIALGSDGSVYVSCSNGTLYTLSLGGALKWKFSGALWQNDLPTIPAVSTDGTIYFMNYALYPGGGQKWETVATAAAGSPAIGNDGTIYYGGGAGVGVSASGQVMWQVGGLEGYVLVPAAGTGYFMSMCGFSQFAADPDDAGWSFPSFAWSPEIPGTGALDAGGVVYVPGQAIWNSATPQLFALDSASGKVIWQLPDSNAGSFGVSIGADGTVYMVSANSVLYAIQ